MLSLRPDVVGEDVAAELEKLQADVPADPPGVAQRRVEAELGGPVSTLYASFESEPFASGSVAQVHRAVLDDGTDVAVKVLHDGAADPGPGGPRADGARWPTTWKPRTPRSRSSVRRSSSTSSPR